MKVFLIFSKRKNLRIRGNMNPAADLLDDDIWGDIPLDKR